MQFIPIVERIAESPADGLTLIGPGYPTRAHVSAWSVEPVQYGRFLNSIFDEWVRHDVGRHYVQIFDVALESWLGMQPSLCVFRETCGAAMAIQHNGDLYSCDHYMRFMAEEIRQQRPPANVVDRVRGRNDSCLCGSGKKYKR